MAAKQKPPAVVAELGRPETASETAARKAEQSRLYKQRKTVNNLVFSLLVTVALVLVMVLIVPRGVDQWSQHEVNVSESAQQNAVSAGQPLVAPVVPEAWKAKQAALRGEKNSDIVQWRIDYTTVDEATGHEAYAAVVQAFSTGEQPVNDTWIAGQLEQQTATGVETIGGLTWTVYDHSERNADESNMLFGLQTAVGDSTLLVYGTDHADVIRMLAERVAAQADTLGLASLAHPAGTKES